MVVPTGRSGRESPRRASPFCLERSFGTPADTPLRRALPPRGRGGRNAASNQLRATAFGGGGSGGGRVAGENTGPLRTKGSGSQ